MDVGSGSRALGLGAAHSMVRFVSEKDGLCMVDEGGNPRLGQCDSPGAVWTSIRGKTEAHRAVRSTRSGLCLQRRCHRGGVNPLRLSACSACGTARWQLSSGRLLQEGTALQYCAMSCRELCSALRH